MWGSRQAQLEQDVEVWRDYVQSLEKVRATLARAQFTDEPVSNLAGVQFNIQKISHAQTDTEVRYMFITESKRVLQSVFCERYFIL